ncbi:R-spondin-3 [Fukomys damarensis]|uniref:R-spondin-3 n=1 Tax=Fukomys damarensis TaxID=885580 RepID=UPI0014554102|nr:R-spondin-3 [Fukomys damarensis]
MPEVCVIIPRYDRTLQLSLALLVKERALKSQGLHTPQGFLSQTPHCFLGGSSAPRKLLHAISEKAFIWEGDKDVMLKKEMALLARAEHTMIPTVGRTRLDLSHEESSYYHPRTRPQVLALRRSCFSIPVLPSCPLLTSTGEHATWRREAPLPQQQQQLEVLTSPLRLALVNIAKHFRGTMKHPLIFSDRKVTLNNDFVTIKSRDMGEMYSNVDKKRISDFSLVSCCLPTFVSPVHPNVSQGCQGGCATCSDYNGCLSCKPRLFFVLERIGMKQIGVCLSSCPSGYYGTRYPDINKCTKCKADCDTCFNKNFCTKCKSGFYLHLGKCFDSCPEGLEANNHTMECISIVHCEAGEWSPWSPCTKKGKTCGFKRGTETRVREIIQHPSAKGNLCPPTSETRKCTVQRKKCQKRERGKKGRERKRKKLNKEESKEAVPDNKGLESTRDSPENKERENKEKQQQKKRKVQDKQQKSVSVSTVH